MNGYSLLVSVTNSVVPQLPAQASVALPAVFPTPAIWTTDFSLTNSTAFNGTIDLGYNGFGAISAGTNWNYIAMYNAAATFTNTTSKSDDGTITNTGVTVAVSDATFNGGYVNISPTPINSLLLDAWVNLPLTAVTNGIVITTQPGFYNVFIYGVVGSYGNRGTFFTVHGTTFAALNVATTGNGGAAQPNEDNRFLLNTNYVIFTNVFITNGILNIGTAPDNAQANFNGLQLQLIAPIQDLAIQRTGTNASITWSGGILVSSPNINGPYTPVNGGNATSPYQVPGTPAGTALFYRMQVTSPVPGVPAM